MSRAQIQIAVMREKAQSGWPLILNSHTAIELLDGWRAMRDALAMIAKEDCLCGATARAALDKAEERR